MAKAGDAQLKGLTANLRLGTWQLVAESGIFVYREWTGVYIIKVNIYETNGGV